MELYTIGYWTLGVILTIIFTVVVWYIYPYLFSPIQFLFMSPLAFEAGRWLGSPFVGFVLGFAISSHIFVPLEEKAKARAEMKVEKAKTAVDSRILLPLDVAGSHDKSEPKTISVQKPVDITRSYRLDDPYLGFYLGMTIEELSAVLSAKKVSMPEPTRVKTHFMFDTNCSDAWLIAGLPKDDVKKLQNGNYGSYMFAYVCPSPTVELPDNKGVTLLFLGGYLVAIQPNINGQNFLNQVVQKIVSRHAYARVPAYYAGEHWSDEIVYSNELSALKSEYAAKTQSEQQGLGDVDRWLADEKASYRRQYEDSVKQNNGSYGHITTDRQAIDSWNAGALKIYKTCCTNVEAMSVKKRSVFEDRIKVWEAEYRKAKHSLDQKYLVKGLKEPVVYDKRGNVIACVLDWGGQSCIMLPNATVIHRNLVQALAAHLASPKREETAEIKRVPDLHETEKRQKEKKLLDQI